MKQQAFWLANVRCVGGFQNTPFGKRFSEQCAWSCSLLIGTTTILNRMKPLAQRLVNVPLGRVLNVTWKDIWRQYPLCSLGDVKNRNIYQPLSSFPVPKTLYNTTTLVFHPTSQLYPSISSLMISQFPFSHILSHHISYVPLWFPSVFPQHFKSRSLPPIPAVPPGAPRALRSDVRWASAAPHSSCAGP